MKIGIGYAKGEVSGDGFALRRRTKGGRTSETGSLEESRGLLADSFECRWPNAVDSQAIQPSFLPQRRVARTMETPSAQELTARSTRSDSFKCNNSGTSNGRVAPRGISHKALQSTQLDSSASHARQEDVPEQRRASTPLILANLVLRTMPNRQIAPATLQIFLRNLKFSKPVTDGALPKKLDGKDPFAIMSLIGRDASMKIKQDLRSGLMQVELTDDTGNQTPAFSKMDKFTIDYDLEHFLSDLHDLERGYYVDNGVKECRDMIVTSYLDARIDALSSYGNEHSVFPPSQSEDAGAVRLRCGN